MDCESDLGALRFLVLSNVLILSAVKDLVHLHKLGHLRDHCEKAEIQILVDICVKRV